MAKFELIRNLLTKAKKADMPFPSSANTSNGWKISIQGRTLDDVIFLYDRLHVYLIHHEIPFKIGTKKRLTNSNKEQARKIFTIYCPNNMDINKLCESVYNLIRDYRGWYNIPTPTSYEHYAGGLYFRNDRDEYGNYIAGKRKN